MQRDADIGPIMSGVVVDNSGTISAKYFLHTDITCLDWSVLSMVWGTSMRSVYLRMIGGRGFKKQHDSGGG